MTDDQIGATTYRYARESIYRHPEPGSAPVPDDSLTPPQPPEPPTPPRGPGGGRPVLRAVPVFPDGTEVPDNRHELWQAIERTGTKGITIPELVALGPDGLKARGSISDPLMQWQRKGWIVQVGTRDRSKVYAAAARSVAPARAATDRESATISG